MVVWGGKENDGIWRNRGGHEEEYGERATHKFTLSYDLIVHYRAKGVQDLPLWNFAGGEFLRLCLYPSLTISSLCQKLVWNLSKNSGRWQRSGCGTMTFSSAFRKSLVGYWPRGVGIPFFFTLLVIEKTADCHHSLAPFFPSGPLQKRSVGI